MKIYLMISLLLTVGTTSSSFADVVLSNVSSINLNGTTVTCGNATPPAPQCTTQKCLVSRQSSGQGAQGPLQYSIVSYTDCSGNNQWVGGSSCATAYVPENEQCIQSKLSAARTAGECY